MAYFIRYAVVVEWIPDGAGPMSIPAAQRLQLGTLSFADLTTRVPTSALTAVGQPQGFQSVPGLDAPTQNNFRSAMYASTSTPAGGMLLDLDSAIATNLARIQGFASGGG